MGLFNGETSASIGLIAGQGDLPVLFAEAAQSLKKQVVVLGLRGYTDPRVESFASSVHYLNLGSLGEMTDLMRKLGVRRVVLAGGVPKKEMFNPAAAIDDAARNLLRASAHKGDDHLLKAFVAFLKLRCGVTVVDCRSVLKDALAAKGVMTRRPPTSEEMRDVRFGWRIAKQIGRMDIGQTVVVKDGAVLAVEAMEGTDAAIQRGGSLGNGAAVVVKTAKPNQDLRFDLPCVGAATLEIMQRVHCRVLAVEAGKTLVLSKAQMLQAADRADMTVVGL